MCAQGVGTQRWKTLSPASGTAGMPSHCEQEAKRESVAQPAQTGTEREEVERWGEEGALIDTEKPVLECLPSMYKAVGSISSTVHASRGRDPSSWEVEARIIAALIHSQSENSLGYMRPSLNTTTTTTTTQSQEMGTQLLSQSTLESL